MHITHPRFLALGSACLILVGCDAPAQSPPDSLDDPAGDDLGAAPDGPVFVGGDRPVEVHVPEGYDHAAATPLLLVLHGYGGTGAGMATYLSLRAHADDLGLLLMTPDGTPDSSGKAFWNASDACCDFEQSDVDDSAYLSGMIEEVGEVLNLDRERVFMVGHSNGAFMSYRMACDHAELMAGIVSIAGAMPSDPGDCDAAEGLAALQIHGTADETVLYAGGAFGARRYPGAVESVESWAALVGCSTSGALVGGSMDHHSNLAGADTVATAYADDCDPGGHAELWTVDGMGHIPVPNASFMPAILDFLLDHPKP